MKSFRVWELKFIGLNCSSSFVTIFIHSLLNTTMGEYVFSNFSYDKCARTKKNSRNAIFQKYLACHKKCASIHKTFNEKNQLIQMREWERNNFDFILSPINLQKKKSFEIFSDRKPHTLFLLFLKDKICSK